MITGSTAITALRLLDPGGVRWRVATRTVVAAVAALLVTDAVVRSAHLPGGMVVIATVLAVLLSRSLHATSLPHRLSALAYVPVIGIAAAFTGRFMLGHAVLGPAVFVAAVAASRYLMRFGGTVRRLGRLALTPLISVLVVPIPPTAARATGPLWGGAAGVIAVTCVITAMAVLPTRPTREAAAAAHDVLRAAARLRALPAGAPARPRAERALHRAALTTEDRLAAARLPATADHTPLDALSAAVLRAEVLAATQPATDAPAPASRPEGREPGARADARVSGPDARETAARASGPDACEPGARSRADVFTSGSDGRGPGVRSRVDALASGQGRREPAAPVAPVDAGEPGAGAHAGALTSASGPDGHGAHTAGAEAAAPAPPAGGSDSGRWEAAVADVRIRAAAVRALPAREHPAPDGPAARRATGGRRRALPQTRLTAQLAAAMAAAFAAGHLAFAHRWTWTVITAFVVCAAARSRGDVVHRSGLRIAGASVGAVTGTLVAHLVADRGPLAVTVILGYLLAGLWLRDLTYAAWTFCVTSMLAVLYTMDGERGGALLVQRPEGILIGSACGIAAAYFVLPLRTETVLRGRAARALHVLQDLLGAARDPEPRPAEIRRLARAFDRATRDLVQAAAPARAHRSLLHRPSRLLPGRPARALTGLFTRPALLAVVGRRAGTALAPGTALAAGGVPGPRGVPAPGAARGAHAADWTDALAACAPAVRALAAADPGELAAAGPHLALAARNTGQVRRRLGLRPDAEPPRVSRGGPAHLSRLNAALADLYDRLPVPPAPKAPVPAAAPAAG
jgi:hypothetical protein